MHSDHSAAPVVPHALAAPFPRVSRQNNGDGNNDDTGGNDASDGFSFESWQGVAIGAGFVFIIFVIVKYIVLRKPLRSRSRARRRQQQPHSSALPPLMDAAAPPPPPPPAVPGMPSHPSAVYVGGRYVLYPARAAVSGRQDWPQYPYPVHLDNFHHSSGVTAAHPIHLATQAPRDNPEVVPRFNPEDLVSFEATGDDRESPCPICLGLLEEEPVSAGQCLHLMHTSCLKSWLAKDPNSACPVCRVSFHDPIEEEEQRAAMGGLQTNVNEMQPSRHSGNGLSVR